VLAPVEPTGREVLMTHAVAVAGTLDLTVLSTGRSAVVRLVGRLDEATSRLLQAVLDPLLHRARQPTVQRLVLDCAGLRFADAAGLSPILHARAVLGRRGGSIELRRLSQAVRQVIDVLDLTEYLDGDRARPA
jgi:anti-anti-sigma factor